MIFLTGDTHREVFTRFEFFDRPTIKENFTNYMNKNDYVIILGDFGGVWFGDCRDKNYLEDCNKYPFTTLFIDGNHENFDALNSYPIEKWNGGYIHKINDSVFHLMRGQIFNLQGKRFFTFGGAPSEDITGGVFDSNDSFLEEKIMKARRECLPYRINHINWWKQEIPNSREAKTALDNLSHYNWNVNFILTHTCPNSMIYYLNGNNIEGEYDTNEVTNFLQKIKDKTLYDKWYSGHMHIDSNVPNEQHHFLYHDIIRVV